MSGETKELEVLERFVEAIAGEQALRVLRTLLSFNDDVTEEIVAKYTGLPRNAVRKSLYKLEELNLVVHKRLRDAETGWYSYYWRPNKEGVTFVMLNVKKAVLSRLKERLEAVRAGGPIAYICPRCEREYSFDSAFSNEFKCANCNESLVYHDKSKEATLLEKLVRELEEEITNEGRELKVRSR
ncbi:MAG: hypothetical protein QXU97_05000 [Fervidicoccaceae archaeon]